MTVNLKNNSRGSVLRLTAITALLACLLLTVSCGKGDNAKKAPPVSPQAKPKIAEEVKKSTEPEKEEKAIYSYNPVGKRDPFERFTDIGKEPGGVKTPLQEFDLGQLKLVGIIWGI